jgi:peptidoglycan/xylan/chitin deacetylase (PgdA/CDA1 family)
MDETTLHGLQTTEFTYQWYGDFLEWLRGRGYEFGSFDGRPSSGEVLLRHDVDLSVEAALRMARIEADHGVRSAYFFLLTSSLYNVFERPARAQIREIESLGHDVGLHFSTHTYWPKADLPREDELTARVETELSALDTVVEEPLTTVSFHIPPIWVLDRAFEHVPSTYEPQYFSEIGYLADSGQRWRDQPPTARDFPETLQVLTHPGLWHDDDATFEECIERAIVDRCRTSRDMATREFIAGEFSR